MKTLTTVHRQAGMTLIEIMIALLIGAFLIGGILQIFTSSKQTYRMQEGLSRLQENGRFAMEFITHDIRMAGYWGCFANGLGGITNNLIFDVTDDDEVAAFGYASGIAGNQGLPLAGNSALDPSDDITIRGAKGSGVLLTTAMPQDPPAGPGKDKSAVLTATAHGFNTNDLIYVTDCNNADIFQASSVTANTISHAASGTPGPGNTSTNLSDAYDVDAQLYTVSTIQYSIQPGAGGQNALFKKIDAATAAELVEGIENMQILYGEDTDTNRTPDYYVPEDSVVNMNNVVSIRVSLLLASTDNNLALQPLAFTYNGATTTPVDRRIRKVFTSTIAVRNRLP